DADRMIGEVIAGQGDPAAAQAWLEMAADMARRGDPADHPRRLFAELSLARNRARPGQQSAALALLDSPLRRTAERSATPKLRWRASAYAAEARCSAGPSRAALQQLDGLLGQLATAQPDGGVIPREVQAIREGCARRLLASQSPARGQRLRAAAKPAAAPS